MPTGSGRIIVAMRRGIVFPVGRVLPRSVNQQANALSSVGDVLFTSNPNIFRTEYSYNTTCNQRSAEQYGLWGESLFNCLFLILCTPRAYWIDSATTAEEIGSMLIT
jgi:hypothetical protein